MFRLAFAVSVGLVLHPLVSWGQQHSRMDTIHSDKAFGIHEYNIQMPLGQTFVKSGKCNHQSTVRYMLPNRKVEPVFMKDTIGPILLSTVSIGSQNTQMASRRMRGDAGHNVTDYQLTGSMTVGEDPGKYLMELRHHPDVPVHGQASAYRDNWCDEKYAPVRAYPRPLHQ